MTRYSVLGNGSMLVCTDKNGLIRDYISSSSKMKCNFFFEKITNSIFSRDATPEKMISKRLAQLNYFLIQND